jgi:phosphohistidine phosphatase
MDLILWRHAEAEEGLNDHERRLTPRGVKQAEKMAEWLRARLPEGARILVSPAKRTQQTVKPLDAKFETVDAVGVGASAAAVLAAAGWPDGKGAVLVVGHQPTLGEVASLLLCGDEGMSLSVKKGAVWWFSRRSRDGNATALKVVMSADLA